MTVKTIVISPAQRLDALLEHTGELDKAQVLLANIPRWLATPDLKVVQDLKAAFEQSFVAQGRVASALEQLNPLGEFCKQQMTAFLKGKWAMNFDVERDTLDITQKFYSSTGVSPFGTLTKVTTTSRSLLHAAMENFTLERAQGRGLAVESTIRIDAKIHTGANLTLEKFASLCRELDLGARYQRHIAEALALPAKPLPGQPVDQRASMADVRHLKLLDMQVAAHVAYLKQDISQAAYTMVLGALKQDVPAAQNKNTQFDGAQVFWQGLTIHDACICGVLVFSKVSIDAQPNARCVVYMPNEPRRPLFEYASLEDFKVYLTLHLNSARYKKFFAEHYLHGHDKADFFTGFDQQKSLGTLTASPADTCLGDFFFSAFVSKTQEDARILAVPSSDVDEQQREKTVQLLVAGGLLLLNAAAFFVPVIGQLMLVAAVADIVSEVYEGVVDWTHGERTEALVHLLNIVESVAQMAAFAAGGKIVSALGKSLKEQVAFYDGYEAVTRADGQTRLWKPDLEPYKQTSNLPAGAQPDSHGLYQHAGLHSIAMDGAAYRVARNTDTTAWRINHPLRANAFQPLVERNVEGGWRHVHEHAEEWRDAGYALGRNHPRLNDLGVDLEPFADISELSTDTLHHLHQSQRPLPQRLSDCVERYKIDQSITRMVAAMERGDAATTDFVQEQLHTLPGLPGWPRERFIEVRDERNLVVSRYPATAPHNDDINSVHVSQAQLDAGQLLDTVISGLYPKEVESIIGNATTEANAPRLAKKIAASLKNDRQPLYEWLYENWDGTPSGDVATLREVAPDLPVRICEEVLNDASARDRVLLRDRKVPGIDLAREVAHARAVLRQDRALTGLHFPPLANADSDRLALGLMERLQGWSDGDRIEVRQGSVTGAVLDSVGAADAPVPAVIVKTTTGFQVTHSTGNIASTLRSDTLVQALLDVMPASQRSAMGFIGNDALDVPTLRARLAQAGSADRARIGRLLRGEPRAPAKHLSACVQANPSGPSSYSRGLLRKVRKLYPLFSDDQASAFLDAAGTTPISRANRIKALQQQLQTLLGVLRTWRDDEAQMRTQPGRLEDIRVARHQVAKAIENCWRRVAPARLAQSQNSLTLQRNPVGPLPTLTEEDVAHVRHLAVKDMLAGDELVYFIKPFKNLVTLELDRNHLTRLPEALAHMPDLEHLSLDGNQIQLTEYTLRKLSEMRNLRTLGLKGNRLGATIDVRKMLDLESLFLSDTHATELPVGLVRLPNLKMLDLRNNQISELPDWLFRMRRQFTEAIDLRNNPVSATSLAKVTAYAQGMGVGMGVLENKTTVLNELKARDLWMPNRAAANYASRDRDWSALKNEPAVDGFFQLLADLGGTSDSEYAHEDMTRRIWSVIEATQSDGALRDQLLSMAVKANCADAAATIFSNLEVAVDIDSVVRHTANAHEKASMLLSLGQRLFRLDYLKRLAGEKAKADPTVDPVEVELTLRVRLADRLDLLGQPSGLRYASLGKVTQQDLDDAVTKIFSAERSSELLTYISCRAFWIDFLREHCAKRFSQFASPFHARLDTALANHEQRKKTAAETDKPGAESEDLLAEKYREEADVIGDEKQIAEAALLEELTETFWHAEKSATCFPFD